jgi:hypothetical protein
MMDNLDGLISLSLEDHIENDHTLCSRITEAIKSERWFVMFNDKKALKSTNNSQEIKADILYNMGDREKTIGNIKFIVKFNELAMLRMEDTVENILQKNVFEKINVKSVYIFYNSDFKKINKKLKLNDKPKKSGMNDFKNMNMLENASENISNFIMQNKTIKKSYYKDLIHARSIIEKFIYKINNRHK